MLRKITGLIALLLCMIVVLCSCSNLRAEQLTILTNEESSKIQPMSEEIIRCLTEGDKEAFVELFCEQAKNIDGFTEQVDKVFNYFVCDSYIRSEIGDSMGSGESITDGERTEWYVIPEIIYIEVLVKPDGDYEKMYSRYYRVKYKWQITNKSDSSLEGLHCLSVELLNSDNYVQIGMDEFMPN